MNDNHLMDLIAGSMARMDAERLKSASNMTLGDFIAALSALETGKPIRLDNGDTLGELMSYRGYYCDLAFEPVSGAATVGDVLATARGAMGQIFEGYKGGDFPMHANTILWLSPYGDCDGIMITAVIDTPDAVVVLTGKDESL